MKKKISSERRDYEAVAGASQSTTMYVKTSQISSLCDKG